MDKRGAWSRGTPRIKMGRKKCLDGAFFILGLHLLFHEPLAASRGSCVPWNGGLNFVFIWLRGPNGPTAARFEHRVSRYLRYCFVFHISFGFKTLSSSRGWLVYSTQCWETQTLQVLLTVGGNPTDVAPAADASTCSTVVVEKFLMLVTCSKLLTFILLPLFLIVF